MRHTYSKCTWSNLKILKLANNLNVSSNQGHKKALAAIILYKIVVFKFFCCVFKCFVSADVERIWKHDSLINPGEINQMDLAIFQFGQYH